MKYTPKFFKENLPEYKRQKDSILLKLFYRPCSFFVSSFVSQFGITANSVSFFSAIIAIIACVCFLTRIYAVQITGAVLVSVWLLLDCTDGNIARSIKKQPFGGFADAMSSYLLIGFLPTCIGVATYFDGGLLFPKECIWIVLIGAIASSSDSLMRLIYQKYINTERTMEDRGVLKREKNIRKDESQVNSFIVRIEMEFGIAGILPILILICTILKKLDIVVLYCFAYYFLSFIVSTLMYVRKAIKYSKLEMK